MRRDLLLAAGTMGEAVPAVACLLLFGRDERVAALLPRASVTAVRYAGENTQAPEVERVRLNGNLHTPYEACLRFVRRYCDLWDTRPRRVAESKETESTSDVP